MFIVKRYTNPFSPVGTLCVKAHHDINISSLPNQRQMRVWHLAGLKRGGGTHFSINISSLPNQRQMRVWHLSGLKRRQSQ